MPISIDTNIRLWPQSLYQYGKESDENSSVAASSQASARQLPQYVNDSRAPATKKASQIECQTCKNRKYTDGSDDPGVSFKSAAHIDPRNSSAVVMAHEQEHVRHETAKAAGEKKDIVSQSVSLQTSVCPECGRVYTSGGVTRTVTRSKNVAKDLVAEYYNMANPTTIPGNLSFKV